MLKTSMEMEGSSPMAISLFKKTLITASTIALTTSFAHAQTLETGTLDFETFAPAPAFSWGPTSQDYEADYALAQAEVQLRNDGLSYEPQLNVSVNNGSVTADRSKPLNFQAFWNYGAFIHAAEVRIFEVSDNVRSEPLQVIPLGQSQNGFVQDINVLPEAIIYVLRVYDAEGRYDETEAKPLTLVNDYIGGDIDVINPAPLIGYGIDRTAKRNILVRGSSVTVSGRNMLPSDKVTVRGQSVPIDSNGKYVMQTILPFGQHTVDVNIQRNGQQATIHRDVFLDNSEFFYVSIGDVTLGTAGTAGPAELLAEQDEDFDDARLTGRGAMYLKGHVNGEYIVTGAIDTGEERLQDIFRNLDQKDPRQLLRRLDSDRFYPVYGDDSTTVEDAPTQGRFFFRIEKDHSHLMWGNFATQITSTEFAHLDRGLYGAIGDYNSQAVTSFGERKTQVTGFAADPGTIPAREEYRGTGGSLYFLNRQDLSIGSERVRVEIRDKVSGLVVESRELRPQEDYDVDYVQGRILLSDPLQSTTFDNQVVRDGALSGNDVFLVVRYEYTPTLSDVDGYTLGGRATHWAGDHLRLGVTAQTETTDAADQNLIGADAVLRHSEGTYIKGEIAQTDGAGFAQSRSTDGGFLFEEVPAQGVNNVKAQAYRIEAAAELEEFTGLKGQLRGYYDLQEDGFSGANRLVAGEVERFGAGFTTNVGDRSQVNFQYDEVISNLRGSNRAIYADVDYDINSDLNATLAIRHDERSMSPTAFTAQQSYGQRTDLSLQVDARLNDRASIFGFGQATLDNDPMRQDNSRAGIGGNFKLNERITVNGEVSTGDGGLGANAQASFQRSDNSRYYLGYALSTDRTDTGFATSGQSLSNFGTLTFGANTRFNESLSVYGEERLGFGRDQRSFTHAYGLTFNPSEIWSLGASIENGQIEDDVNGTFDRTALAFSAARATEDMRLASSLEARFEDGDVAGQSRDRTTWLMRNTVSYDANEDWEMLGRFNFAISESDQADFLDADFIEGVVGAAYRPVDNDRFNGLLKYTYFEDLSPAQQISSNNQIELARQKSQIFSIDGIYDVTEKLSLGGKYGFRSGEVALDRTSDDFVESDAHIAIVRADYHVVKEWDVLLEGRMLSSSLADNAQYGALAGVYRHIGDNAKLGVGYNFSKFSDDLTDFEDDNDGFFINLVGKF